MSSGDRHSAAEAGGVVLLSAVALALRLTSVSRGLFTDELYSLALAQRSFGHMVELFGYEANGMPYPISLWPLIRVFGTGPALLRAPAVIAGVASVPAMWWAARQLAGRGVALLAAALLALNPMAVFYSQQARAYAYVVLAGCLAFGALGRAVAPPPRRWPWVLYALSAAAVAYCDLLAAPIALPAWWLMVRGRGRETTRRWLLSLLAALACCLPLAVAAVIARSRRNALYWLPKPTRGLIEMALQEFTGGFSGVSAVRWITLAAGAVLVGAAAWSVRASGSAPQRRALAVAAAWGLLPGALLVLVSFVEPVFWPRYAIIALPGLCLLVALAAGVLWPLARGAVLAGACLAAILALAAFADVRQRHALQENWAPAAALLRAERAPGQPTIVDNALVLPSLGYYDPAFRAANGDLIVQEWRDLPLPAGFVGYKDRTGYGSVPNGPPSAATIAALARRGGGTVWMVVADVDPELQADPREGAAVAWARAHCRVQTQQSLGVWVMHASGCSA